MSEQELVGKMLKVKRLSAAIVRAERKQPRTYEIALEIQELRNQRRELLALMPRLRLVGGTDARSV